MSKIFIILSILFSVTFSFAKEKKTLCELEDVKIIYIKNGCQRMQGLEKHDCFYAKSKNKQSSIMHLEQSMVESTCATIDSRKTMYKTNKVEVLFECDNNKISSLTLRAESRELACPLSSN